MTEKFSIGDVNKGSKEIEPGLLVLHDFTKYGVKGKKGDLGKDLIERSGKLYLGGWDSGSSGTNEDGQTQLLLSGKHNSGANNPNANWETYKLKIEGYNNNGPTVYPIYCRDENKQVDLYLKNRSGPNTKSELYIGGDLKINNDVNIIGNLKFGKNSNINNIKVNGDSKFQSNVTIMKDLIVNGNSKFQSNVTIMKDLIVNNRNMKHHIVPKGTIVAFYSKTLPYGWAICNGTFSNGFKTPDLRGRFILHEKSGRNFKTKGGLETVKLTVSQLPKHNHRMNNSGNHNHSGKTLTDGFHRHSITNYNANFRHGGRATEGSTKDDGDGTFPGKTNYDGNHSHSLNINNSGNHIHNIKDTGGDASHENMPPYYVLIYIIKCI